MGLRPSANMANSLLREKQLAHPDETGEKKRAREANDARTYRERRRSLQLAQKIKAKTFDLCCQTDCPELIKKSSPHAREMVAEEREEKEEEEKEVRRVRERLRDLRLAGTYS